MHKHPYSKFPITHGTDGVADNQKTLQDHY